MVQHSGPRPVRAAGDHASDPSDATDAPAVTASIGVAIVILTDLVLLPFLVSFVKFDPGYRARVERRNATLQRWWRRARQPAPGLRYQINAGLGVLARAERLAVIKKCALEPLTIPAITK